MVSQKLNAALESAEQVAGLRKARQRALNEAEAHRLMLDRLRELAEEQTPDGVSFEAGLDEFVPGWKALREASRARVRLMQSSFLRAVALACFDIIDVQEVESDLDRLVAGTEAPNLELDEVAMRLIEKWGANYGQIARAFMF